MARLLETQGAKPLYKSQYGDLDCRENHETYALLRGGKQLEHREIDRVPLEWNRRL